jgi:hypothetical protein
MNKVKHYIKEIRGKPEKKTFSIDGEKVTIWNLPVVFNAYGKRSEGVISCQSKEEAKSYEIDDWVMR